MTTAPSTFILETFPGQIQQERNWCWAAACASINNYFLHPGQDPLGQCEVANLIFGNNNCCESPDQCDSPSSLASALTAISHLNSYLPGSAAAVPGGFAAIADQIGLAAQPVAVRIQLPDGGDHDVIICGYGTDESLLVWDPGGQYVQTSVPDWLTDLGDWLDTYFTQ